MEEDKSLGNVCYRNWVYTMVKVREDTRVRRMVYTQERGSLERKTYLLGRKNNMHD